MSSTIHCFLYTVDQTNDSFIKRYEQHVAWIFEFFGLCPHQYKKQKG
jgi:hypothetical protein